MSEMQADEGGIPEAFAAEHGVVDDDAAEVARSSLRQAGCWLLDGCPPWPLYGMAGGTPVEERAQRTWKRLYGTAPLKCIAERFPDEFRTLLRSESPDRAEVERLAKAYAAYEPGGLRALLDYVCGPEAPTKEATDDPAPREAGA